MRCAIWRGSMMLRPSTSQRTGSLTSSTHQLWSEPRRTMHQSRMTEDLAMIRKREKKVGRSRNAGHGPGQAAKLGGKFARSVRGPGAKTSTKKREKNSGKTGRKMRGAARVRRRLIFPAVARTVAHMGLFYERVV